MPEGEDRMKYFPIMQELFESDTALFLLVGLAVALAVGIRFRSRKKAAAGAGISLLVYAACEVGVYLAGNYLAEIVLLFAGTLAIGGVIGFLAGAFFVRHG